MTETYARIPLSSITPSPYQYRKTFDGLDELAASITAHGVLQPIRVRPNGTPDTYELVFGERRWRASKLASVDDIPALIVEMTDDQVIEQQLIENLRREDVHPLEEAEGYHNLLEKYGYTMDALVAKTGRSRAHLYGRLKLVELAPGAKRALLEGRLSVAVAELVARIPDAKLQEQATKECLGTVDNATQSEIERAGILGERIEGRDDEKTTDQPLSFRAAHALLRRRFATKLALAKFDPADATLTAAGACTTCPHRSGNQLELPNATPSADDLCTKPSCFEAKTKAAWERAAAAAEARGLDVVDAKAAKNVFGFDGVTVQPTSPYVDLTTALPSELQRQPGKHETFGKLLGKKAAEIPRVLVQDETGAPRELIDRKKAVEALRELGKIESKPEKPKAAAAKDDTWKRQNERDQAKQALRSAAFGRVLAQVAEVAAEDPGKKETAWLRWLAHAVLAEVALGGDVPESFLDRRGLEDFDLKALTKEIDGLKSARSLLAFLVEFLVACQAEGVTDGTREKKERFEEACTVFGLDFDEALEAAKEAAKAEAQVDKAKAKKGAK